MQKSKNKKIYSDKNIVKVITEKKLSSKSSSIALSFKRKYDFNEKENIYQHIGIYAYNIKTLQKFVKLSQTQSEIDNKLEQLRALDNKLKINVILAKSSPIGVDTKEDYLALKKNLEYKT